MKEVTDKNGVYIQEGDILRYISEKWPERFQPLHGVALKNNEFVLLVKRGKKWKSWQPLVQTMIRKNGQKRKKVSFIRPAYNYRWEVIGNRHNNPELLQKDETSPLSALKE